MQVTFEEMNQARDKYRVARQEFSLQYLRYLTTVLENAEVLDKLVKIKGKDLTGQFKVADTNSSSQPWEIKFYPLTKNGEISLRSKYLNGFYSWKEDTLVEQLKNIAEVVGDLP